MNPYISMNKVKFELIVDYHSWLIMYHLQQNQYFKEFS